MTKIFSTYSEFLGREDELMNGVSTDFAENNPQWEKENVSNDGCWNCSNCSRCSGCSGCSDCSGCSRCSGCSGCFGCSDKKGDKEAFTVPAIENIHQKILAAASQPNGLDMSHWHTCDTTHCRAGWAVHLAGPEGYKLAGETSTIFAALQIYKASSPIHVAPTRFFESNEKAMEDMQSCAAKELITP
jgi:hypothetical protein